MNDGRVCVEAAELLIKGFNVKSQSNQQLWFGCSGIGLERWASAFYAQKGLDPDGGPAAFREIVGELPEGIRFL